MSKLKLLQGKLSRDDPIFYRTCVGTEKAKIAIMIDSTGSMGKTLQQVKAKVTKLIGSLAASFPNQFQISIMFYYGPKTYATNQFGTQSRSNKIHCSDWLSSSQKLNQFVKNVDTSGGDGKEAVQVALYHLLRQNKEVGVTRAMLIGDMPGPDGPIPYVVAPEDLHRFKNAKKATPLIKQLSFQKILEKLLKRNVVIDTYPIGSSPLIQFKEIANATRGKVVQFNPQTQDLSAEIQNTIKACIAMKR